MSNLKEEKNWKLNKKNCRKWPRLYRVIKKRHDVYDDFERKEEKIGHQLTKKTVLYINWKKINFLKNRL